MSTPALHSATVSSISNAAGKIADLQPVYALVVREFEAVNTLIPEQLTSDVALVGDISKHIIESGGKRLRPLMVLLTTGALAYEGAAHIRLAATIEFLHTATLLHDDVVDHSGMRRGKVTANERWGNAPSILVGDFLYSRAFQMMVDIGSLEVMAILADATNTIAEGEVLQLANIGNVSTTEPEYREIIRCKTALLFQSACHSAATLACDRDHPHAECLKHFGLHFGMAYQLVDDWLDYMGDAATLGKNVGDDLSEGKLTLPLIYALEHASAHEREQIENAIANRRANQLPEILAIVRACGAMDYVASAIRTEADLAMSCLAKLPNNPYVEALKTLTEYSTARVF